MLSLARKSTERETLDPEEIVRCRLLPGDDTDSATAKLLQLVGQGKRVLALGYANNSLLQALREQGCEVEAITAPATGAGNVGEGGALGEVEPASFDVVLVIGVLEHLHDPPALLQTVKKYLRREGYVVAAVPNVAHGNVRLALLGGRFPFGETGNLKDSPLRFFTYDSMVSLFEEAEFGIGIVERQEEDISIPDGLPDALPAELLDSVTQAPEARTAQFITVAYPLPWRGLSWLQGRMRTLAEQHNAARNEAAELHQDLEAVNCHVRLLIEQQEASVRREKELRAQVLAGHEQLTRRDEEYRQQTAALQEQVKQTEAWWIARLEEASAQLALRDRTIQQLAADREAQEVRLERFRRSLLGRFFKRMRKVLSRA